MMRLVCSAYFFLLRFDWYLWRGNFERLYAKVRTFPIGHSSTGIDTNQIARALDLAAIWYPWRALCLQRSAATVCLLRTHGIPGQLVLGAQKLPFKAHAWVEVNGHVVGDLTYIPEIFAVLDRC